MVLDPFGGTLSVAKACLSLRRHRRCVCYDIDKDCKKYAMPTLVILLADFVGRGSRY